MASIKAPKKSETIEVRLSHEAKTAFAERCRDEQRTVSDALRGFIEREIAPQPVPGRPRAANWRLIAAAGAGIVLGLGAAVPSLARAPDTGRAAFDRLDRNHDGMISYQEFHAR